MNHIIALATILIISCLPLPTNHNTAPTTITACEQLSAVDRTDIVGYYDMESEECILEIQRDNTPPKVLITFPLGEDDLEYIRTHYIQR